MDADEFRRCGKEMVDFVADYLENIRDRRVFPSVQPGYLRQLIPDQAPEDGERWEDVFKDIERVIMPGVTHWHSPQFHAYYPTANSYPAIVADILSDSIGCIGFSWVTHWQNPNFHAYYPANASYPSLLGDLMSSTIGCIGFTWVFGEVVGTGVRNGPGKLVRRAGRREITDVIFFIKAAVVPPTPPCPIEHITRFM